MCRRCGACHGWGCRRRRRRTPRRRSRARGRRRTAARAAGSACRCAPASAACRADRATGADPGESEMRSPRWFGSMLAWILGDQSGQARFRRLDDVLIGRLCSRRRAILGQPVEQVGHADAFDRAAKINRCQVAGIERSVARIQAGRRAQDRLPLRGLARRGSDWGSSLVVRRMARARRSYVPTKVAA